MRFPQGYFLKGVEILDYVTIDSFELDTLDTYNYGRAPTAGRDDRIGWIFEVCIGNRKTFILYDECYYHYSITENRYGDNIVYVDEDKFIRIPSSTTDYSYEVFTSYEDAKKYLSQIEETGYYVVR